jgi:squalene synthase HpnC
VISPDRLTRIAEKETRRLARSHYENFVVASVLLPRSLRQPFYNVYAFCRAADDLADQSPSPEVAQSQLNDTFAGRPRDNLFIALRSTIGQFQLPKQPFDDLLAAFRQDQSKRRYENFDQLLDYCSRSANPVGRIVLRLGDCDDPVNAELSDQICTGLQLANCWQDVARDYVIGRVYLPADQMSQFAVNEEMLAQSRTPQPLRQLLASQCDRAEEFLQRGLPLAGHVPRWLANDVKLFAHGGLATLDAIRRIDFDVLGKRPTVSRWRQAGLVLRAMLGWI